VTHLLQGNPLALGAAEAPATTAELLQWGTGSKQGSTAQAVAALQLDTAFEAIAFAPSLLHSTSGCFRAGCIDMRCNLELIECCNARAQLMQVCAEGRNPDARDLSHC
jgi:hypothetical protein